MRFFGHAITPCTFSTIVCVLCGTTMTIIPNINEEGHTDEKEKGSSLSLYGMNDKVASLDGDDILSPPPPPPWETATTTTPSPTQDFSANDDPCWFFELPRLTKTLPPLPDGMSGRGAGRGGGDVGGVPIEQWHSFWTEVMAATEREKRCSRLLSLIPIVVCLLVAFALPMEWAYHLGIWAFCAVPVAMVVSCLVGINYNARQNEKFIEFCKQQDEQVFRSYGFSLTLEAVETHSPTPVSDDEDSRVYMKFLAFRPVQSARDHHV